MSWAYETLRGSSVKSSHSLEYRVVVFFFALYTFGIFYVLCSGLINTKLPSEDVAALYGINKVSGFYGPGSWAAWLLTTVTCCIDRLFRSPREADRPPHSVFNFSSGIDLNLIAVYSYPLIAGVDLIRRSRRDLSCNTASIEIGCIAASLTVLRMGSGLGTLLAGLCLRRREVHRTLLPPVVFTITASFTLFLMSVIFDSILIGFRAQDFALNLFGLPGPQFRLNASDTSLGALLKESELIDEEPRLPLLTLYLTGGDMAVVPRTLLSMELFLTTTYALLKYERSLRLIPAILGMVFLVHIGLTSCLTMSTFWATFFCAHFWFVTDVPITTAGMSDLDQLSVLCLSGVLILANTLVEVVPGYTRMKRWVLCCKGFVRRWMGADFGEGQERGDEPILVYDDIQMSSV